MTHLGWNNVPENWRIVGKRAVYRVREGSGATSTVCILASDITEEKVADACLIAAAPEMLALLKQIEAEGFTDRTRVRELIDKAEGKP